MIGVFTVLIWLWLLVFRGRFWCADQRLSAAPATSEWPGVAVVIPARNEAGAIRDVCAAHAASDYQGRVALVVVDDASSDETGALARRAGAEVLDAEPLPAGWSGKLWALDQGIRAALSLVPDAKWLLLTDADIVHRPETLGKLVAFGEARGLAMVSLMARLDSRGIWGGLLMPAFVFFFQKLYPFALVNRPDHGCAAAAGGCVLIRREALEAIGGISSIRGALIDDCTLAATVKRSGRAIWLGLSTGEVISLRDNRPLGSIWTMVTRTAFTQLHHSAALLTGSVLGMALVYLAPPWLLIFGAVAGSPLHMATGAVSLALMIIAYAPTLRLYEQPFWRAALLPVAAALFMAMTVASAVQHWRGRGGRWKGRTYP